jgi:hypothetical protein
MIKKENKLDFDIRIKKLDKRVTTGFREGLYNKVPVFSDYADLI